MQLLELSTMAWYILHQWACSLFYSISSLFCFFCDSVTLQFWKIYIFYLQVQEVRDIPNKYKQRASDAYVNPPFIETHSIID